MKISGLSQIEVARRVEAGEVNSYTVKPVTAKSIVRRHTLTLFNFIIFFLAVVILLTGHLKDTLFIFIAIANALIAIINDIHAKNEVEKLQLIAEKHAHVMRDGIEVEIEPSELVKDDIIILHSGDQIICDSVVVDGFIEVNESFVTGESDSIKKSEKDPLISGSFIVSGSCLARITAVGEKNTTNQILESAKAIKTDTSELFRSMQRIVKYISIALLPISIFLFLNQYSLAEGDLGLAVASTASALLSMIPEGLMLLISSVLALATIRLSEKHVLVSDMYSIETLARVDTICLDKTGTLTTGNMLVEKSIPLGDSTGKDLSFAVRSIINNLSDKNSTSEALQLFFKNVSTEAAIKVVPFSSERKYSGACFESVEYYMGAYEFLPTKNHDFLEKEQKYAKDFRVITIMKKQIEKGKTTDTILGFVLLRDEPRKNAKEILTYFKENDVDVKIISGDNLATIEKVCSDLRLDSFNPIDLSTLTKKPTEKEWEEIANSHNLFARVRPDEKKFLVKALESSGHTVAMTGDGVNDVLALKEADCGISLGSGTDAARKVARLVLLDDDFSVIPDIIAEGRRTINNVTRSSSLFLNKTIFAAILSITFIFINYIYPFTPVEMSLINPLMIGIPSFLLALEANYDRVTTSVLKNAIKYSLPTALCTVLSIILLVIAAEFLGFTQEMTTTASYVLTLVFGFFLIYRISRPLNRYRKNLLVALISVAILALFIPAVRHFYGFI